MPIEQSETDFTPTQYLFIVIELTVLAAIIRFCAIGTRGLWIDEAYSWAMTQLNWHEFWTAIRHQSADMTVYYVLLKFWVGTGIGDSEAALRSLSALFSIATVPVVAEVGRRLYSAKAGLLAAAIFAVHVFSIHYAQEARSYSAVTFFVCLSWYFLVRFVAKPSNGNLFWFGLFSLLAIYSHLIAGLNLVAQVLSLLLAPKLVKSRAVGLTLVAICLLLVPGITYSLTRSKGDLTWIHKLQWWQIRDFLDSIAGGIGSRVYLAIVTIVFLAVIAKMLREVATAGTSFQIWASAVPVFGFLVPVLALVAISMREPMFVGRYIAFTLPAFIWGLASLCTQFGTIRYLASFALVLGTLLAPLPGHYKNFVLPDRFQAFRAASQYIAVHGEKTDGLVAIPAFARPGMEYYGSLSATFPEFLYPDQGAKFQPATVLEGPRKDLGAILYQKNHIWVVVADNGLQTSRPIEQEVERALANSFELKSQRKFYGLKVAEYESISRGEAVRADE